MKRDGHTEPVMFDKITSRICKLCYGLNPDFCDPVRLSGRDAGARGRPAGPLSPARSNGQPQPPAAANGPRPPRDPASEQVMVAQKVTTGVYKGVTTSELDELAAETAASMTASHPDYALVSFQWQGAQWHMPGSAPCGSRCSFWCRHRARPSAGALPPSALANRRRSCLQLAARIAVSNLHKNTMKSFSET